MDLSFDYPSAAAPEAPAGFATSPRERRSVVFKTEASQIEAEAVTVV
jgi:hypothetical protein